MTVEETEAQIVVRQQENQDLITLGHLLPTQPGCPSKWFIGKQIGSFNSVGKALVLQALGPEPAERQVQ